MVTFAAFIVCHQLSENLFPYEIRVYEGLDSFHVYLIYFPYILFKTFILIWLINCINQNQLKLIGTVIFVMYGLQTFMMLTEMWFYRNVYDFTDHDIRTFFLQNLIILALIVPIAVWVNRAYNKKTMQSKKISISIKWIYLSLIYLFIYFTFRYFVVMFSSPLQELHWGNLETYGFIEYVKVSLTQSKGIIFFQVLRGLLWIVFVVPIIYWCTSNKKNKLILLLLSMTLLPTLQMFFPNPLSGYDIIPAHALGVSTSNLVYALLIFFTFNSNSYKSKILTNN